MTLDAVRVTDAMLARLPRAVRAARERDGLSYRAAALRLAIPKSTLMDLEAGRSDPPLSVIRRLLAWLTPPEQPPIDVDPPLSPAAESFMATLIERQGLGQAYLRLEPRLRGLVVPDLPGTFGELHHVASYTIATIAELTSRELITLSGLDRMPPYYGRRNRARQDFGWRITVIDRSPRKEP